jgi:phosphatidylserine/phosphatidylglycerophosphate/cardiolipin synthase-like enzyme
MRYLDTGSNDPDQTLGWWLESNCKDDIASFKAQFGYFSFAAVRPFVKVFRTLSDRETTVDFVLGSNNASLRRTDLESLVEAVAGSSSTITVVAFQNAEFHPKTAHISSNDGSKDAIVTSANLTVRGASRNVEAGISLSTRDGDDPRVLGEIEEAIDRWKTSSATGVYRVNSLSDVRSLKSDGVIGEKLVDTFVDKTSVRKDGRQTRGTRSPLWRPSIE